MTVRPPRLWLLLLAMNLVALLVPFGGLSLMRIYESALVRQTETELVAQAAVLSAAYVVQRKDLGPLGPEEPPARTVMGPLDIARRAPLDLAQDEVLPPVPDKAALPGPPAAASALRVGAALSPVLRASQEVTLAALRITDPQGTVIATTGTDMGMSLAALMEVQRAMAGEFVSLLRSREHKATWVPQGISRGSMLRVHVAMPVVADGRVLAVVVLSRTPADILQAAWGKRWAVLALLGALLGTGAVLAWIGTRLIARPIGAVTAQARLVASGGTGPVVALARPGTREVQALSSAIASMAETLERRAVYVRDLAAHVAHEFKTPIAAASGAAELAGESDIAAADRTRLLATVQGSLTRLDRLTRRLLELARADMTTGAFPPIPLAPLLCAAASRAAVPVRVEGGALQAAVSADTLAMMLDGLLDNVATHAGPGAAAHISVRAAAGRVLLRVADDGCGACPADRDRLFEPFFTTARATGSTGMGLAIVRALAAGAGGSIRLVPAARGATFELDLPGPAAAAI